MREIRKLFAPPTLEYALCTRKNGTKFIKIVAYQNDYDFYLEVGRINPTKFEELYADKGVNDVEGIYKELIYNAQAIEQHNKMHINTFKR